MAGGWTRDGGVQEQIDASIEDAVARARTSLPAGPGSEYCDDCGEVIPEARRLAVPGARRCVACQDSHDRDGAAFPGYNRRGNKDSQLR